MAPKKSNQPVEAIYIEPIEREALDLYLVGLTPLVFNKQSAKAQRDLLFPPKKTNAERKATMKHDPLAEYQNSVHKLAEGPTLLAFPTSGFKKAMMSTALDVPGATKAGIARQVRVHSYMTPIYGVPEMYMAGVIQAGMSKNPDIRTRAVLEEWACTLQISYVKGLLNGTTLTNLVNGAGQLIGIGDYRQEKGAGDFGLFEVRGPKDKDFLRIVKAGREEQALALKDPGFFDEETEDLYTWFLAEKKRRGID